MTERPIIFSGPMVREILAGRKTQTRRILKLQPKVVHCIYPDGSIDTERIFRKGDQRIHCPYGTIGDRLWVRETFRFSGSENEIIYRADCLTPMAWGWKPSIHISRNETRITLEITGIRVERLQEISYNDVIAEGFHEWLTDEQQTDARHTADAKYAFSVAWDHLNAKCAPWESNPWVWIIEFVRVDKGAGCVARQTSTTRYEGGKLATGMNS